MKTTIKKNAQRNRRHARIRARIAESGRLRLVVFRSLRYTYAQLIDDSTGLTVASAHDMAAKSGTKLEKALAVGKELAEAAVKAGHKECVFDRNGYKYHGRVQAVAEGAREGGLNF